jgi:hypothetical protein
VRAPQEEMDEPGVVAPWIIAVVVAAAAWWYQQELERQQRYLYAYAFLETLDDDPMDLDFLPELLPDPDIPMLPTADLPLLAAMASITDGEPRRGRATWVDERPGGLWYAMQHLWHRRGPDYENAKYRNFFRLSKVTFDFLLQLVAADLTPEYTHLPQDTKPPRQRLAITLHWMGRSGVYDDVAAHWEVGKSTVCQILHQTVDVLVTRLRNKVIQFPRRGPDRDRLFTLMSELSGLPMCAGAIDGCLIPVKKPHGEQGASFFCYKQHFAILLLGVVDAKGRFTYVDTGVPGSVGDAGAWADSQLKVRLAEGTAFSGTQPWTELEGLVIKPYLVGDAAFPLCDYLMKCYAGDHAEWTKEHALNYCLIRTRRVVECAFGVLKMRFAALKEGHLYDPEFMSQVVLPTCILHNIAYYLIFQTRST